MARLLSPNCWGCDALWPQHLSFDRVRQLLAWLSSDEMAKQQDLQLLSCHELAISACFEKVDQGSGAGRAKRMFPLLRKYRLEPVGHLGEFCLFRFREGCELFCGLAFPPK